MLLTGTFRRSVDEKQRISVPKRLRSALEEAADDDAASDDVVCNGLYITPGTDGSLAVYSEAAFARLAERLSSGSPTGQNVRAFRRMFYAQAQMAEMDGQGRVRLDPDLCKWAALGKEVVMVGVGDHIELWDVDRWEAYRTEQQARYDELAELAFQPGG